MKQIIADEKGLLVILPGGTTSRAQPLDVLINRAFKKHVKDLWHAWMSENRQNLTKAGNIKAPSRGEVATWVAKAWAAVDEQLIRRAFVKSGLSQSFIRQTDMMDVDDDPVRGEDSCPLFDHPDNFLSYDDVLEDLPIEFLSI